QKEQARKQFPSLFQWVYERVRPERKQNKVKERRQNWWLFTRPIPKFRTAVSTLESYIAVPRTAKWFSFNRVKSETIPDTSVVAIAVDDFQVLGVLESTLHKMALH